MIETLINKQIEQEFAYVDSIISAHTNSAIAKVNAEALQTYWEIGQFVFEHLHSSAWGDHVVGELAEYLQRKNPKRKGYGKRSLYNMVKLYEVYSSKEFEQIIEQLKLSEFVQSQIALINAHSIVQLPAAQTGLEIVQSGIAQFQPTLIPPVLCLISYTGHVEILNRCHSLEENFMSFY